MSNQIINEYLALLLSANSAKEGEAKLRNAFSIDFQGTLTDLVDIIADPTAILNHRLLALTLLKKKPKDAQHIKSKNAKQIKEQLVSLVHNAETKNIRSFRIKLAQTIRVVFDELLHEDLWALLETWLTPQSTATHDIGLAVLQAIIIEDSLPEIREKFAISTLKNLLNSTPDRELAIQTACDIITSANNEASYALIPNILDAIGFLNGENRSSLLEIISSNLTDLFEQAPTAFKKYLNALVTVLLQITKNEKLDDKIKAEAVSTLVNFAEVQARVIKKNPTMVESIVQACIEVMIKIEDDQDWETSYKDDNEEKVEDIGESSFDRFALLLGGKIIHPIVSTVVPQLLSNPNWKYRVTGLNVIGVACEACHDQYTKILEKVVKTIIQFFKDPDAHVRYAAINNLAHVIENMVGAVQHELHAVVVPALLSAMDDSIPRIIAHAARSMVNFLESSPPAIIAQYSDTIITKLMPLMDHKQEFVQEHVLSTIACFANSTMGSSVNFEQYYAILAPKIKELLKKQHNEKISVSLIRCLSTFAEALGKSKIGEEELRNAILLIEKTHHDYGLSNVTTDILAAWARIAACLGNDFEMEKYMAIYSEITRADHMPEDGDDDAALQNFNPETLKYRVEWFEMLKHIAISIRGILYKHINTLIQPLVYALQGFQVEMKESAVLIMGIIADSLQEAYEKGNIPQDKFVDYIEQFLAPCIAVAPNAVGTDDLCLLFEQISKFVQVLPPNSLGIERVTSICDALEQAFDIMPAEPADNTMDDPDDEDGAADAQQNADQVRSSNQNLCLCISEILNKLITTQDVVVKVIGDKWIALAKQWLVDGNSPNTICVGLCIGCDLLEHKRKFVLKQNLFRDFVNAFIAYGDFSNHPARQAALYGLGLASSKYPDLFAPYAKVAAAKLKAVLLNPAFNTDAYEVKSAMCNALSSMLKMSMSNAAQINVEETIGLWLRKLPGSGDAVEAEQMHNEFVTLVQTHNSLIMGKENSNLVYIMKAASAILSLGEFSGEVKLHEALASLKKHVGQEAWKEAFAKLSTAEKKMLE